MKEIILTIIQKAMPDSCLFDAHAVIDYLIKYHREAYESGRSVGETDAHYHSVISKEIATFEGTLLERMGDSWSKHVNGEFCLNKCWLKV